MLTIRVRFGRNYFKIKKGVGQGLPLSGVLSEFYYNDMELQVLNKFTKVGSLFRYVDDFLYLTDNREVAEEFWKMTKTGIQSYNCHFQIEKSRSNVDSVDHVEFNFLGFTYNVKNMEVRPDYSGVPIRYNLQLGKEIGHRSEGLFIRRICKFLGLLKLYTFVLDARITSRKTILETLSNAAKISAEKCFLLLINMFDIKKLDRKSSYRIFLTIKKKSVNPILKVCYQSLKVEGCSNSLQFKELQSIFWYEYMLAFRKNSTLCRLYNKFVRKEIDFDLLKNIT